MRKKIVGLLRTNWTIVAVVLVVLAGRSSLADHYVVPTGSMEPTLMPGDRVLVDKIAFGLRLPFSDIVLRPGEPPAAGDIVVFDSPADGTRLIKRVVALSGDRVELRDGLLRVNDRLLAETSGPIRERFADRRARLNLSYGGGADFGPTVVPAGRVLVLGDSRGNSRDSRSFGFVETADLYARATGIYFRRDEGLVWKPL